MSETAADFGSVAALYDRQCAGEQIHLLGGVQPHGFVLVVDRRSGLIVQVSAGVTRHWPGIDACETLLGTPLQAWVDPAETAVLAGLQDLPTHVPTLLRLDLRVPTAGGGSAVVLRGFECLGHAVGPHAVLEWIATGELQAGGRQASDEIQRLSAVLSRLRNATNLDDYVRDCVVQLQAMSGYDRVMLYRFLPDWSGDIVAEQTGPGFEPRYQGLRFPATDIPPQARSLYERNPLRMLVDTEATPDRLLPERLPDGLPLDQSYSLLRSLSPVHQGYLRNMGVRASLVISLLVDGKLWGLLTCHHHQPWTAPHDTRNFMRSSCELIANVIGTRIDDLTRLERRRHAEVHVEVLAALSAALEGSIDIASALRSQADALLQTFDAIGWGVQVGPVSLVSGLGHALPAAALLADVALLAAGLAPGSARQHLQLGKATPPGLAGAPQAAGALIARLPFGQDGLCVFLRPELVTEVDWAGDPDKLTLVTSAGEGAGEPRLEPRRSFALWRHSQTGCARAWTAADEEAAAALAALIGGAFSKQLNREWQRELEWRAQHDALTGLLNRSVIERELALRWGQPEAKVALFLIDIDHFKRINDTLGHEVGDQVLKEAARRFTATIRGADLAIRMGGDEFLLIADFKVTDPASLNGFADRLHAAFAVDFRGEGWTLRVRISVGVAFGPEHGSDAATLLRHADMALYEAKGQGRSRSAIFDSAVESRLQHASGMEAEIARALHEGEFRLHYQPKVDLRTLRVIGLEALVRWQHPQRGLLGPAEFIALAETSGQIEDIGRWVIGEAAAQLSRWRAEGHGVWPVAVNVSFVQIVNGTLLGDIRDACSRWQIPLRWLELELTETVAMENTPQTVELLNELVGLGLKVALDDFGTGFSSLAHVRQLPLDCLKIDRSFIGGLESDPQSLVVTLAVIGMAHGLNLGTVAEGVETRAQMGWLIEQGCDIGQGYLFSRPVPADQVPQAVAAIERADWR